MTRIRRNAIRALLIAALFLPVMPAMADELPLDARTIFEMIGIRYCEPVPSHMPEEDLNNGIAAMQAEGEPLLEGVLGGFMDGRRGGISQFGTRSDRAGFAAVHSIWGARDDGSLATLCLATIQIGDHTAGPGSFRTIGLGELDEASEGDVLVVGVIVTLTPTGRVSERGLDVLSQQTIGELQLGGGVFEISSIGEDAFEGRLKIDGLIRLDEADQDLAFALEAETIGMQTLQRVPTLR
jgi:hypothetical protein